MKNFLPHVRPGVPYIVANGPHGHWTAVIFDRTEYLRTTRVRGSMKRTSPRHPPYLRFLATGYD